MKCKRRWLVVLALAAAGHEREHHVIAGTDITHLISDPLDDSGPLVPNGKRGVEVDGAVNN